MEDTDGFFRLYHALMEYYRMPPDTASRQLDDILKRVSAVTVGVPIRTAYSEAGGSRYGQ